MIFNFLQCHFVKAQTVIQDFEKEKIYFNTNHVFYKPGEEIFFKIYVVNAKDNRPTTKSKVVHVQLISPSGEIAEKFTYELVNGTAKGSYFFSQNIKGGIYKLKAFTNWMQNETDKNYFEKEITVQKIVSPRVLMKLDFPKKGYGAGSEVNAEFSMKNLANIPISFYSGIFEVFVDGEILKTETFITNQQGKFLIKFQLPNNLKTRDALLNIKVKYDGFDEAISKNIPISFNTIDLRFFPEGGSCISDLENNMAFKALDEFQKPVDVSGEIFDEKQNKVGSFKSYRFGMGEFLFTPKSGEKYVAKITEPQGNNQIFQLPKAKQDGIVFRIVDETLVITSRTSQTIRLVGSFRNQDLFSKDWNLRIGTNSQKIPKELFPSGIARFTIYGSNNLPLAERVTFLNEDKKLYIELKTNKNYYLPREKVELEILTKDESGNPIPSDLYLSVIDDKLWTYADDKQDDITSWLQMNSELSGKIEEPNFYFKKEEAQAKKSLDLVMLTNGYRYFELIPDVLNSDNYKFPPEQSNSVYGVVKNYDKEPIEADVYLVETDGGVAKKSNHVAKYTTGKSGEFFFNNLDSSKYNRVIAKSKKSKEKSYIEIISYQLQVNPLAKNNKPDHYDVAEVVKEIKEAKEKKEEQARQEEERKIEIGKTKSNYRPSRSRGYGGGRSDSTKVQDIEQVVVIGYGVQKTASLSSAAAAVHTYDISPNVAMSEILQGRVAGLTVSESSGIPGSTANIQIRGVASLAGNNTPLYVVDGVPTNNFSGEVNVNDISSVIILKDAAATSIYGSRGANGVVVIATKKMKYYSKINFDLTPKSYYAIESIPNDSLSTYSYSRVFEYPEYKKTSTPYRIDFRETIYWNPVIQTDKDGKAKVEFYNSDANTTFRAISEGISYNGLVGREEKTYATQSPLAVDAKIPPYLTMGDQPKISTVIKNNSNTVKTFHLNVVVPRNVELGAMDSLFVLKPLEAKKILIPLKTGPQVNSNISVLVNDGDERETTILPFKVEEKGFLNEFAVMGSKDSIVGINLKDAIPGTISARVRIFDDRQTRWFQDLDRLQRKPHGCFEQLSSTIYPNIFVLDYAKSLGKLSDDDEKQAVKNLKYGYEQLINYQLDDGGFGYFSSSESQNGVTAYAISEFTDLKKVIDVNPNIISKAVAFLLKRRDGIGLFKVDYTIKDEWSKQKFWAEQAYVLNALSKAGIKDEIEKEYQVSLSRVNNIPDLYQIALLMNVAHNLNKPKDFENLAAKFEKEIDKFNWNQSSGFTGSRGQSLSSEAYSLYLSALLKSGAKVSPMMIKLVDKINANNGIYGYGSTQSTALALEALSKFYVQNQIELKKDDFQTFKINDETIDALLSKNKYSDFTAKLKDENILKIESKNGSGFPYQIEWRYFTLNPPKDNNSVVKIQTTLAKESVNVGDINRLKVEVQNKLPYNLPMVTAEIGIPAGLSLQPNLLKDLITTKQISYYEIFNNYLVLYWESMTPYETKIINLDLKAEFPGTYNGKASSVYLYYNPESKSWALGNKVVVD